MATRRKQHNPARNRLRNRWHPHCPGRSTFVFGSTRHNGTYHVVEHNLKSKREAEELEEYSRRTAQGHPSDNVKVGEALNELQSDADTHLLSKLPQALGEFGIYGALSPCSLPLPLAAMSIVKKLRVNESDDAIDMEQFDCAERQRSDRSNGVQFPQRYHQTSPSWMVSFSSEDRDQR